MECKKCKYLWVGSDTFPHDVCDITHVYDPKSCDLVSDEEVETMDVCYNCQHWYGMGDWGLSCAKNYYNCSYNGFDKACEQFERRGKNI